ncbi:ABC transporter ATP-binding protein [Kaistia sp. 32K]|uniref:ABC transporter ATP-binding protein n=1 Tax=Kaistia sp. 32K TaxID=2795690 RepID=UPI0019160529|nr:ABC transporter ATP-binding protein [Kaistia sp. 32K]BCP52220.1 ABC transporter ATP-binding protein [Kaistia sp. 32K]
MVEELSAGILEARAVSMSFSGLRVLSDVSLGLAEGDILGLIGPNGAGKTTLVNVLSGFTKPGNGEVRVDGRPVEAGDPAAFVRAGVVRTFQNVRLFSRLSVRENILAAVLARGVARRAAAERTEQLMEALDLTRFAEAEARSIPYGDERRVGIARALAGKPRFLLLDEPAAGLNGAENEALIALIARLPRDFGCGILLIEHNMQVVMALCSRLHVLDGGRTIAVGAADEVRFDPNVIRAYLGRAGEGRLAALG